MFTGIIQAKGHIEQIEEIGGDKRLLTNVAKLPMADWQSCSLRL